MRVWIVFFILTIATPVYAQTTTGSTSGASSMVDISSPANTTTHLVTTPTVAAPGLAAAGIETCLGSASGGLSLMGGGITFGATKVDEGCTIRLLARQLYAFGLHKAAVALMCQDRPCRCWQWTVAGSPCPSRPRRAAASMSPTQRPRDYCLARRRRCRVHDASGFAAAGIHYPHRLHRLDHRARRTRMRRCMSPFDAHRDPISPQAASVV